MDIPVEIELGMEKLEAQLTISGYDPEVFKLFGLLDFSESQITLRGAIQAQGSEAKPVIVPICTRWLEGDRVQQLEAEQKHADRDGGGALLQTQYRRAGARRDRCRESGPQGRRHRSDGCDSGSDWGVSPALCRSGMGCGLGAGGVQFDAEGGHHLENN